MRKRLYSGRFLQIALVALVIIAAGLFATFIDFQKVWLEIRAANYWYLAAASVALLLCLTTYAVRWRVLLDKKPDFLTTFHTANVGHGVNTVIPMRAGEVTRIMIMGGNVESGVTLTEAASSYVVERMFEQVMRIVALGAAVMLGAGGLLTERAVVAVLAPLGIAFVALLWLYSNQNKVLARWPQVIAKLPYITEGMAYHSLAGFFYNLNAVSSPRRLVTVFVLTGITWFWGAAYHVLVLASIGHMIPLDSWLPVALAALAFSPPTATTQPIIFQSIIVAPLTLAGYDQSDMFTYAILLNASQMVWMLLLGLWGLTRVGFTLRGLQHLLGETKTTRTVVKSGRLPEEIMPIRHDKKWEAK